MTDMLTTNIRRNVSQELVNKVKEVYNDNTSDMYFHVPVLQVVASRCSSVLELGVRDIKSTWPLLFGLASESFGQTKLISSRELEFISNRKLISIDIEDPKIHGADISEVYRIAKDNDVEYTFLLGDTINTEVKQETFDAIFFDTDHTYEQLSAELKIWAPRANTWLLFHDTTRFGKVLIPAINEFLQDNPEWIIVPNMSTNNCMGFITLAKISMETWEKQVQEKYENRIGNLL